MVFHTAPPHPASKARIICSPLLVGGAEASQKGLGERIPAKFPDKPGSRGGPGPLPGLGRPLRVVRGSLLEPFRNGDAGPFPVRDRIHVFSTAIHAIAAR